MCGNPKGSKTTDSSSTFTPNPQAGAAYSNLLPAAQQIAQTQYNPATGQQVAGLTPQQQQAFGEIGQLQGSYQPYLDSASDYISASGSPITPGQISGYENPYQSDVIKSTMDQLGQLDATQQQGVLGNAISQNALGGSRTGVTQAALQGQQSLSNGATLAGLNSQNYSQALAAAQGDRTAAGNAGVGMANLGNLAQTLGLTGAQALYGAGAAQQNQAQTQFNAGTANEQAQQMYPYQNAQWLAGILSGIGPLMGGTTNGTSTTTQDPGIGGILGGLLTLGSGLRDGGPARRAAGGGVGSTGFDFSNFFPWSSLTPAHVAQPALPGAPSMNSPPTDYSKMAKGLGNLDKGLFGTSTSPTTTGDGWETSVQTDGLLGSGGLESILGFAAGGAPHLTGSKFDVSAGPGSSGVADASYYAPSVAALKASFIPHNLTPSFTGGSNTGGKGSSGINGSIFGKASGGAVRRFDDGGAATDDAFFPTVDGSGITAAMPQSDALSPAQQLINFLDKQNGKDATYPANGGGKSVADLSSGDESQGLNTDPVPGLAALPQAPIAQDATPKDTSDQPTLVKSETYPGLTALGQNVGALADLSAIPQTEKPKTQPDISEPANGISDNGVDFIKRQEDFSPKPYGDYKQTSIGYGTKALPGETSIDRDTAEARLRAETSQIGGFIQANAKVPLSQNQYDALTSFGYNVGTGPLGKVLSDINNGDVDGAMARMKRYNEAGGSVSDDLVKRRDQEVAMFQGGDTQSTPGARPTPAMAKVAQERQDAIDNKVSQLPPEQQGGLLYRLFGVNPLGLTDRDRKQMLATGLGMLANGPYLGEAIGKGGLMGMQAVAASDKAQLDAKVEAAKLALSIQKMNQPTFGQIGEDAVGNKQFGFINPRTGTVTAPNGALGSNTSSATGANPNNLHGDDYLKTEPPIIGNQARAILNYDQPPLTGRAAMTPQGLRVMNAVQNASDPNNPYDATQYPTKQAARKDWTSGKTTNTLRNGNTGIGHLFDLTKSVDAIDNTSYPAYNATRNAIREQVGDPRADTFNANAGLVAEELTSFYRGAGGNEADIQRLLESFNAAKSKDQQKQVLGRIAGMVQDKVEAMKQSRDWAFGAEKGEKQYPVLTPRAKSQLAQIEQWAKGGSTAPTQADVTPPVTAGARPVGQSNIQLRQAAQAAIARGADPAKVNQRLEAWGVQ